jgi:hypothetical protein
MQDCVRGPTSSGSVSLGRRGETLTSTRRSYDRDPAEYSSKVQQRRRHSAMFSEVRTCLLSLNDAQRDPCRHFASKGLGVRVPLAPPLVRAGLPLLFSCTFGPVQQEVQQQNALASFLTEGPL